MALLLQFGELDLSSLEESESWVELHLLKSGSKEGDLLYNIVSLEADGPCSSVYLHSYSLFLSQLRPIFLPLRIMPHIPMNALDRKRVSCVSIDPFLIQLARHSNPESSPHMLDLH